MRITLKQSRHQLPKRLQQANIIVTPHAICEMFGAYRPNVTAIQTSRHLKTCINAVFHPAST